MGLNIQLIETWMITKRKSEESLSKRKRLRMKNKRKVQERFLKRIKIRTKQFLWNFKKIRALI